MDDAADDTDLQETHDCAICGGDVLLTGVPGVDDLAVEGNGLVYHSACLLSLMKRGDTDAAQYAVFASVYEAWATS